jgi:hypothetical protein
MDTLIKFAGELTLRLFSKTPLFFKIVQIASVVVALVLGLPDYLAESGVQLPEAWTAITDKIILYVGVVGAFIAQLTVTAETKETLLLKD